jgi:hypothetical protein
MCVFDSTMKFGEYIGYNTGVFWRRQSAHDLGTKYRSMCVLVVTGLNAHYSAGTLQQ